jgi:CxxC-x17-CxxC domain-containing protein
MYPKKKFDRSKRFGPKRDFGRSQLYSATCVECGNECEVPFKPMGNRPVFCRACFKDQGEGRGTDDKLMYPAECDQCGKDCKVPFKPAFGRPVFCHRCMAEQNGETPERPERMNRERMERPAPFSSAPVAGISPEQFKILNDKLDQILEILEMATVEADEFEEEELPPVKAKPKSKKKA